MEHVAGSVKMLMFYIINSENNTRSGTRKGIAAERCRRCDGRGVRLVMKQIGPGMIQQMQTVCDGCSGKGIHAFILVVS